jgi:hypothetical protein
MCPSLICGRTCRNLQGRSGVRRVESGKWRGEWRVKWSGEWSGEKRVGSREWSEE